MASDLAALIRAARLDDPKSLKRLAHALNREGYDDGVLKQFELTWWAPSGVVLRAGVLFEGGRGKRNAFRTRILDNLAYHLAVHPIDAWSEAEIALTEDSRYLLRRKTFWRRQSLTNEATLVPDLDAIRDRVTHLRNQAEATLSTPDADHLELQADALAGALEWIS